MNTMNLGLDLLHITTGAFFITTGYRKNFMPDVRAKVEHLFDSHHVPKNLQVAIMAGELLGGMGLFFGCLTRLAAVGLLMIMWGAYLLDTLPGVEAKQTGSRTQLLSNAMCNPEFQLIVVLTTIALVGPGTMALDAML